VRRSMDLAAKTVVGALRVVRMLPVLEVSGLTVLAEVDAIVTARGRDQGADVARDVARVRQWSDLYEAEEAAQHLEVSVHMQLLACEVAFAVAGSGGADPMSDVIEYYGAEFWELCDGLVHEVDGYRLPAFRGIKTTLAGVEEGWWERDWALVNSGIPLDEAFQAQTGRIAELMPKRREIAQAIAQCGGWAPTQADLR
jgi:hypothetical protein